MKHTPPPPFFLGDGLWPPRHIDDAQPPHAQADAIADEKALVIGSAVDERVGHPTQDGPNEILRLTRIDDSGDPAHGFGFLGSAAYDERRGCSAACQPRAPSWTG